MKKPNISIACDVQPILDSEKTGIGWVAKELVSQLDSHKDFSLVAQAFAWNESMKKQFETLVKPEWVSDACTWFRSGYYKMIWPFIPIPYTMFFKAKADVQIFFNNYLPPGVSGKRMLMIHDMAVYAYPETLNWKTKYMLNLTLRRSVKRADHLLTVSEFSKKEMVKYLGILPEKISVIPNGVDFSRFHTKYPKASIEHVVDSFGIDGDYFLYLGTLEPRKNIPKLIEAYALLKQKLGNVPRLVLAGRKGWLYDSIFLRVTELGLAKEVLFTGYVSNEDAPLLMAGAKAFVFPSLYEGFGMPPLEAMACGTPAIVANTASLPEVVGDCGLYVDPFSVESMVQAMERMVVEPGLRDELSAKGIERAQQFNWNNSGNILAKTVRNLVGVETA